MADVRENAVLSVDLRQVAVQPCVLLHLTVRRLADNAGGDDKYLYVRVVLHELADALHHVCKRLQLTEEVLFKHSLQIICLVMETRQCAVHVNQKSFLCHMGPSLFFGYVCSVCMCCVYIPCVCLLSRAGAAGLTAVLTLAHISRAVVRSGAAGAAFTFSALEISVLSAGFSFVSSGAGDMW